MLEHVKKLRKEREEAEAQLEKMEVNDARMVDVAEVRQLAEETRRLAQQVREKQLSFDAAKMENWTDEQWRHVVQAMVQRITIQPEGKLAISGPLPNSNGSIQFPSIR